jgi:hypothetical protein
VLLTPELSLWGYPPRDLLLQPSPHRCSSRAAPVDEPAVG